MSKLISSCVCDASLVFDSFLGSFDVLLERRWEACTCPRVTLLLECVDASASTSGASHTDLAPVEHSVDESQPSTSIQIRTTTGGRIIAKFNNTSTIADLKRSVSCCCFLHKQLYLCVPPSIATCMLALCVQDKRITLRIY